MAYITEYSKRPLWQWLVIYLVIGGLVYYAVYYFYFAKKGVNPYGQAAIQTVNQNIVTITPSGFQPSNIAIKAGTTVTWTNSSGTDATINSNPHPVHTGYSSLNLGVIKRGVAISLMFPTPGKYAYHNHLQPSQIGTITVQ